MPAMKRMKAYETFDDYLVDQSSGNQKILRELRGFVKQVAPDLRETVKWGNGCWVNGKKNVAFAYSGSDHVQFGFFSGSALRDPDGLLEGEGKYVRHIKIRSPSDINERAFAHLLKQAVRQP